MGEMGLIDVDINFLVGIESMISKNDLCFIFEKGVSVGNLFYDILEYSDFSVFDWEEMGKELVNCFGLDEKWMLLFYEWLEEVL